MQYIIWSKKRELVINYFHIDGSYAFIGLLDLKVHYVSHVKIITVPYVSTVAENILLTILGLYESKSMIV